MKRSSILFFIVFFILILIFTAGCTNASTNHSTNNVTNNQLSPPSNSDVKSPAPIYTPTYTPTYTVTVIPETLKDRNIKTIKNIVEVYHSTHTYTVPDMYACAQMSQDVWDQVETAGIPAVIIVGRVDQDISSIQQSNHAWVTAEVSPGSGIAMETTGGYLVCPDPTICAVNNPRYYTGWHFNTPLELQNYINNPLGYGCPAGYKIGNDNLCHQTCSATTYCTGNSACVNQQCVGVSPCSAGSLFGNDNLCHTACSATTYCTGNSACVDQQCISCSAGYYLGTDLQCHKNR